MNRMNGLVLLLIAIWAVPVSFVLSQEEAVEGSAVTVAAKLPAWARDAVPSPMTGLLVGNSMKIACSSDGKLIAFANANPTRTMQRAGTMRVKDDWKPSVIILDVGTGKTIVSLELLTAEEDEVLAATERVSHVETTALAFSPDGKIVAVGTSIGVVKLYNARTGEIIRSLDDEAARMADKETPEDWKPLRRAMGSVTALDFSPNGRLLATCGNSFADFAERFDGISRNRIRASGPGRLKVWDVQTGTLKHDLAGHNNHATAVCFSPDGQLLASAGRWYGELDFGNGIILWNANTGAEIRRFRITENGFARSIAFSPDSKRLAIGSQRFEEGSSTGGVSLVRVSSGVTEWLVTVPGWAKPLAFSSDGRSIVVLCGRESIRVLDTETGMKTHEFRTADSLDVQWDDVALAPEVGLLAIAGVDDEKRGSIEFRDLDDPDTGDALAEDEAEEGSGAAVAPETHSPTDQNSSPRAVAEAYIAAVREGRVDDALALVKRQTGSAGRHGVQTLGKILGAKPPVLETVLVSQRSGEAAALFLAHFTAAEVLSRIPGADSLSDWTGRLLLLLSRVDDGWLVSGLEFDLGFDEAVANELRSFQANCPDAAFDWIAERKPYSDVEGIPPLPSGYASPPPEFQPTPYAQRAAVPRYYQPPRPYRFLEGDEIDFECAADSQLDRKVIVQPDGMITLRLLGQVKAAGLTVAELREQLEEAYKKHYHTPGITVTPTRFRRYDNMTPAAETTKALPEPRYVASEDLMVSWSENGDAVWGFSKRLGIWGKQVIDPPAKEPLLPVVGGSVACVQVGRRFYGYSSEVGWWNPLELPADKDLAEAVPVVEKDLVLLTVGDSIYTFASSTGCWSSRDGSIGELGENVPDTPPSTPADIVELRADYSRFEQEAAGLVKMLNDHPGRNQVTDVDAGFRTNLTKVVRRAFEARQQLQRVELAAFRLRLDALQERIDDRERRQDEIVKRRVEELLDPNLKWEPAVDEPEAGDSAEMGGAGEWVPAVPQASSPQFEIDAYFSPTPEIPKRTNVAKVGQSVFLIVDVASLDKGSFTGVAVSIQLDESLQPQTASEGYEREGHVLTWKNRSVEANVLGRYAVECLCRQPSQSVKCLVTVTDASGQQQSCEASLRIDPGEMSVPAEGEATDTEQTIVPEQEANDGPSQ